MSIDLECSHQKKKWQLFAVMGVLADAVIVQQFVSVSNQHGVHLNDTMLYVNCISRKPGKNVPLKSLCPHSAPHFTLSWHPLPKPRSELTGSRLTLGFYGFPQKDEWVGLFGFVTVFMSEVFPNIW